MEAEGTFCVVNHDYGFQIFLHRGKKKVTNDILIVAMDYAINKYLLH